MTSNVPRAPFDLDQAATTTPTTSSDTQPQLKRKPSSTAECLCSSPLSPSASSSSQGEELPHGYHEPWVNAGIRNVAVQGAVTPPSSPEECDHQRRFKRPRLNQPSSPSTVTTSPFTSIPSITVKANLTINTRIHPSHSFNHPLPFYPFVPPAPSPFSSQSRRKRLRRRAHSSPPEFQRPPLDIPFRPKRIRHCPPKFATRATTHNMNPTTPTTPTHTLPPSSLDHSKGKAKEIVSTSTASVDSQPSGLSSPSSTVNSDDDRSTPSPTRPHRHHRHHHYPQSMSIISPSPLSINVTLGPSSTYCSPSSSATPSPATPYCAPPVIPPQYPLITRDTLKELELEVTLRSPQLRHDLLFDPGLQFRPTSGRRKREQTERYWEAIEREVRFGCTCTCFDRDGRAYACVCGKASEVPSDAAPLHAGWYSLVTSTKSRILPLLETLKEVLHLVIHPAAATAPPADPSLLTTFDPALIHQEITHDVFDHESVFNWVGEVMKMHCAPMRDGMVETMVKMASGPNEEGDNGAKRAVKALRMCFEILEVMKLDIANHQLQALRPYLVETCPEFELKTFQERFEKGLASLSVTRRWLSHAAASTPKTKPVVSTTLLCHAMVDLVFDPFDSPDARFPETLYLDHARLQSYINDASDLLGLYMLIMLFRQLTSSTGIQDWEVDRVKREMWEVGPSRLGLCFDIPAAASSSGLDKWEKGMVDVSLQIGRRAEEARKVPNASDPERMPSATILGLIDNWRKSNYKCESPLFKIMKQRLRAAVLEVVKANAQDGAASPASLSMPMRKINRHPPPPISKKPITPPAGQGLEPLMPEILHLGERIARLVVFHAKVYGKLYEVDGFINATPSTSSS